MKIKQKNIKNLILGLTALSMLSLAACDNSSMGLENALSEPNAELKPTSLEESLAPSLEVFKDSNYIFDFTNTLEQHLDPDTLGINPETLIEIRLTTDAGSGSNKGVVLVEETKYEDLKVAVPIDTIFSPEYFDSYSKDYNNDKYAMRAFITRNDIESAIIKDLKDSEAITADRASELENAFMMTEDEFYNVKPKIVIWASDTDNASDLKSIDHFNIPLSEGFGIVDDRVANGEADITQYTSVKYDIVSDKVMADAMITNQAEYDYDNLTYEEQMALSKKMLEESGRTGIVIIEDIDTPSIEMAMPSGIESERLDAEGSQINEPASTELTLEERVEAFTGGIPSSIEETLPSTTIQTPNQEAQYQTAPPVSSELDGYPEL